MAYPQDYGNQDPERGYSYAKQYPKKKKWPIVLIGLGVLCILACLIGATLLLAHEPDDTEAPGSAPTTQASKGGNAATKPSVKVVKIGEGTWKVGTEVAAGTYRTPGAKDGIVTLCTWQVSTDDDGQNIVTIDAVDSTKEPGRVTLKAGRYFKTSGCQDWIKQ